MYLKQFYVSSFSRTFRYLRSSFLPKPLKYLLLHVCENLCLFRTSGRSDSFRLFGSLSLYTVHSGSLGLTPVFICFQDHLAFSYLVQLLNFFSLFLKI